MVASEDELRVYGERRRRLWRSRQKSVGSRQKAVDIPGDRDYIDVQAIMDSVSEEEKKSF